MPAPQESTVRQYALLSHLLNKPKGLTQDQIEASLGEFYAGGAEARDKMLKRDLEALATWGFVVGANHESPPTYQIQNVKASRLSPGFALSDAEAKDLRAALDEQPVAAQLAPAERLALARLLAFHAPISAAGPLRPSDELADRVITRALAFARDRVSVIIDYPGSQSGKSERRHISPLAAFVTRGQAYVVGVCHRDERPKTFRAARIKRLERGDDDWRDAPGFELSAHIARFNARVDPLPSARLRLGADDSARARELYPWAYEEDDKNGQGLFRFPVFNPESFFIFMLGLGSDVEVIEPRETRLAFGAFLRGGARA